MIKTLTIAGAAVALFAGSVFGGKQKNKSDTGKDKSATPEICKYVVVDGYFNTLFMQNGSWRQSMPVFQEVDVNTGHWGEKHLVRSWSGFMVIYNSLQLSYGKSWTMQFHFENQFGGVCYLDNWTRSYQGWKLPWNTFNDAHFAILSGTEASAKCIPFPGTIEGAKVALTWPNFHGVGDCAQQVSMQYPNATGAQVDPWGESWSTKCYAVFGHNKVHQHNNNSAHRACFFRDTIRPGTMLGGVFLGSHDSIESCANFAKAHAGAQANRAMGVSYGTTNLQCWYHYGAEYPYHPIERALHFVFAKPLVPQYPKLTA